MRSGYFKSVLFFKDLVDASSLKMRAKPIALSAIRFADKKAVIVFSPNWSTLSVFSLLLFHCEGFLRPTYPLFL